MSIGIVTTKYGRLKGAELSGKYEGITVFRSVPYAAPPIGNLRFAPPQDHAPWSGVRDVSHFAPRPYQAMGEGGNFEPWATDFYFDGFTPMSEDCLYLSIATGASEPGEKRPVFMWFHGGGLSTGFYSEHEFDPSELAKKGIIVVSVGQRLNIFGYLCLPQLSAEQGGHSGNYGLLDEIKALDWVRENIEAFGGDPDNITVGGQSGGTAKSTSLALSPLAKGKIKRVINQSNLAWRSTFKTMDEAAEDAKKYLKRLNIDPESSVEALRALPPEAFYSSEQLPMGAPGSLPGGMVWDNYAIQYQSNIENMEAFGMELDYLSGGNVGESALRGFGLGPAEPFVSAADFYHFMKEKLGDLYREYNFEALYPVNDDNATLKSRELAARGFSSGFMSGVITNRYFGAYRKAKGSSANTYSYAFGHYTPCLPEEKGTYRDTDNLLAWHSSELWYTFASLSETMPPCRPWTEVDFRLADTLSSYWANFIATGNPNGENLPFWPESDDAFGWMFIKEEPDGRKGLDKLDQLALKVLMQDQNLPKISL
ncbi:MAG: carboxylesterase family protein [Lachnospiraceae bacterium]|nr:carboxylesterase family protein [Lachnospiraceae bacterium]